VIWVIFDDSVLKLWTTAAFTASFGMKKNARVISSTLKLAHSFQAQYICSMADIQMDRESNFSGFSKSLQPIIFKFLSLHTI
jgi:hypothetical protein